MELQENEADDDKGDDDDKTTKSAEKNIRVKKKHAFHANLRNVVIKTSAKKRSAS